MQPMLSSLQSAGLVPARDVHESNAGRLFGDNGAGGSGSSRHLTTGWSSVLPLNYLRISSQSCCLHLLVGLQNLLQLTRIAIRVSGYIRENRNDFQYIRSRGWCYFFRFYSNQVIELFFQRPLEYAVQQVSEMTKEIVVFGD